MADDAEKFENIQKLKKHLSFQPLRFVHIFLALILTLYGTAVFLAIITVKSELSDYAQFLHYYLGKPVIVLIVGSIILVGIGCLGIISSAQSLYHGIVTVGTYTILDTGYACQRMMRARLSINDTLRAKFGVLLFGLFMFKLTMAAVFLAVLNSADKSIAEALQTQINNYAEYADAMDYIQSNLSCCGIDDFSDWNSILGYVPGSCCSSDSQSGCGLADILNLNETGCHEALKNLIFYFINYLAIILAALVALEVTAMVITVFLVRGMADYRRRTAVSSAERIREPWDPEFPVKARNPLGNGAGSLPAHQKTDYEGLHPAVSSGMRESIVRNPIYRDFDSFGQGKHLRDKIVPPVNLPRLPRAHPRFPVGY